MAGLPITLAIHDFFKHVSCQETEWTVQAPCSPDGEPSQHGDPADATGAGPLTLLVILVLLAAAHAGEVGSEEEQVQSQADGGHAGQDDQ